MFFIKRYLKEDEEFLYKLKKKKKSLIFILLFLPFWFAIVSVCLAQCYENWFLGKTSFNSYGTYIVSIIMVIVFVPLMSVSIMNYMVNDLIITNRRVFIRKSFSASLLVVDLEQIGSYKYLESDNRGFKHHKIVFVLKNRKTYVTNNLFIRKESLSELTQILDKFLVRKKTLHKDKIIKNEKLKADEIANYNVHIFTNYIFMFLYFSPFIIGFLMFIFLICGFNELGQQKDIVIYGFVDKKIISHNSKNNFTTYEFNVEENGFNKYDIDVEEKTFNNFGEGEKVLIRAKKGNLGIVYDVKFFKDQVDIKQ